jgi:hypothetical protein
MKYRAIQRNGGLVVWLQGGVPALQTQSPEFKPQSCQKKKERKKEKLNLTR